MILTTLICLNRGDVSWNYLPVAFDNSLFYEFVETNRIENLYGTIVGTVMVF